MSGKIGIKPLKPEVPTDKPKLTNAGEKLIEILQNPEMRIQSVTDICKHADISRDTYYKLWKNPDFIQCYSELCKNTLLSFAMPASLALGKQAAMGDPACIKMVLEMAGIYQPKASVEHTHTVEAGKSLLDLYQSRQKAIDG